jgi:hypothetical protein
MHNPSLRIINPGMSGHRTRIELDGQDISHWCHGVTFHAEMYEPNTVTLQLYVSNVTVESEVHRHIDVDPDGVKLLESLGWTPPAHQISGPASGVQDTSVYQVLVDGRSLRDLGQGH